MSPTRISIDLVQSPLRVGGLVLGKYIVASGSEVIKVTGENAPTHEEVKQGMEDARGVVKSFFGAPSFDAAVLVVPNTSSEERMNIVNGAAQNAGYNIPQVIREYTAVAAAYLEKENPTEHVTIVIISLNDSKLDVSLLTLRPLDARNFDYKYIIHFHKATNEPIDFEKQQKESQHSGGGGIFGLVGGAVKSLVLDPIDKAFNILKNILSTDELKEHPEPTKVVFVGKAAGSEKLRQAVKERFQHAEVWAKIEDPEEVPAYGAAVLSFKDKKVRMFTSDTAESDELYPF